MKPTTFSDFGLSGRGGGGGGGGGDDASGDRNLAIVPSDAEYEEKEKNTNANAKRMVQDGVVAERVRELELRESMSSEVGFGEQQQQQQSMMENERRGTYGGDGGGDGDGHDEHDDEHDSGSEEETDLAGLGEESADNEVVISGQEEEEPLVRKQRPGKMAQRDMDIDRF